MISVAVLGQGFQCCQAETEIYRDILYSWGLEGGKWRGGSKRRRLGSWGGTNEWRTEKPRPWWWGTADRSFHAEIIFA